MKFANLHPSEFHRAKENLVRKLKLLDLNQLGMSEYSQNYLKFLIDDIWETLGRFEQVIHKALINSPKRPSELTLVDYGGGLGLLSLLAKEIGFHKVIYNDLYSGSCEDVEKLSSACSIKLSHIIQGDARDLIDELNQKSISPDLIVSYDVIEHVYNVDANFQAFTQLKIPPTVIVYGSGANIRNPFYTRRVKKDQLSVENLDRVEQYGHKPTDSLSSYFNLRKEIIKDTNPSFSQEEVELLAKKTRGLIKIDIQEIIKKFLESGTIEYSIDHPTNTCDPMTGNWCEHLLDFDWLLATGSKRGYLSEISKGTYSPRGKSQRAIRQRILNAANVLTGPLGYAFSPFYILTLKPTQITRIEKK